MLALYSFPKRLRTYRTWQGAVCQQYGRVYSAPKSDLSAKEYRNIDSKYRNQLLELKTAEMAASDLNEYHKVHSSWPASLSIYKSNNRDQS